MLPNYALESSGANPSVVSGNAVVMLTASCASGLGNSVGAMSPAAGSSLYVFSGGTASGASVDAGPTEMVLGGTATDTTIAGGTLELWAGGQASGFIALTGADGVLALTDNAAPAAIISAFAIGDIVDLTNVAWTAAGTALLDPSTGVLTVTEGAMTDSFDLDPS